MFPYGALPLYWIFGRSRFKGYRELLSEFRDARREELLASKNEFIESADSPATRDGGISFVMEKLAEGPFLGGNRLELLTSGEQTFESIFCGIENSKKYILIQSYIIRDDGLGRRMKRLLMTKAREGVKVYLLYDEFGCVGLVDSYLDELKKAGVEVNSFDTTQGVANKLQLNFRNHRKIVVIDGEIGFVGGYNIGDEYLGKDAGFGYWRDTHLRIEGPAVVRVQASFFADWYWATKTKPELSWACAEKRGNKRVLVLPSGPADAVERCTLCFLEAINSARRRLWIASPYFVPDYAIINALQLAALRGVDVRIMLPQKPDHWLVWLASFSFMPDIREFKIRLLKYCNGFLHQKVVLVDDELASIGTANMDNRSFRLNFEINILVADSSFSQEVASMMEEDFKHCRDEVRRFSELPLWLRIGARFAALLSPIL